MAWLERYHVVAVTPESGAQVGKEEIVTESAFDAARDLARGLAWPRGVVYTVKRADLRHGRIRRYKVVADPQTPVCEPDLREI